MTTEDTKHLFPAFFCAGGVSGVGSALTIRRAPRTVAESHVRGSCLVSGWSFFCVRLRERRDFRGNAGLQRLALHA